MASARWHILLVDDDDDDQFLITELLKVIQRKTISVTAVSTYTAGLQATQTCPFDAILVDYDLGHKDGIAWIRDAMELRCTAPIIMVTGRGRYEIDLEATQAGAVDYLTKSDLNPSLLERAIRHAIERKQTEEDLRQAKDKLEERVLQRTQELQEREDLLKQTLEILPVGVWIIGENGAIRQGNPASQQIWSGVRYVGIEQYDEYKGWWLKSGQRVQSHEWAAARAVATGEISINEEIEIECFDGTHKIILNSAIPLRDKQQAICGAVAVNQDITERVSIENQLRQANRLLENMFNILHLGIAYLDRGFNFIRVNNTYAAYDGRTPDFFVGKNHFELYPNPENEAIFRSVVETGQPYSVFSRPFVYTENPERGVTYWDWSLQPVYEADGQVSGLVFSLLDTTGRPRP